MNKEYNIIFRMLENKTNLHVEAVKKINNKFCMIYPYFINVNLGEDIRNLLCDGQYIVDVTGWSGAGLYLSPEIKPNKKIRDLITNFVFDANN